MVTHSISRIKLTRSALFLLGLLVLLLFGVLLLVADSKGIAGFTGQRAIQFIFLSLFAVIWLVFFSVKSEGALYFGLLTVPVLVSQTGMQVDLGRVRASALEILILALAMCLCIVLAIRPQWQKRLPRIASPAWLFLICLPLGLILALAHNIPAFSIITMVKGYYLYPLLLPIAFSVIRNRSQLRLYAIIGLLSAAFVSLTSNQYNTYDIALVGGNLLERLSGTFGIINQFGFYLASMALLALAIVFYHPRIGLRLLAMGLIMTCVVGMAQTLSRGAVLGFLAGLLVLSILAGHRERIVLLLVSIALFLALKSFLPESLLLRFSFNSFNDHSTILRIYYLRTAWEAVQQYPLGAGWGAAFLLVDSETLIPSGDLPWYHNDYLNLVAQIGFWGLAIFLWNWWRVYRYTWRSLHLTPEDGELRAYIVGGMAAVTGLLISAGTDHLLQRPDIAGQLWWMTSVLLCAAHLARLEAGAVMTEGKVP